MQSLCQDSITISVNLFMSKNQTNHARINLIHFQALSCILLKYNKKIFTSLHSRRTLLPRDMDNSL